MIARAPFDSEDTVVNSEKEDILISPLCPPLCQHVIGS